MRNKDITLNVLLQYNDMSALVLWYEAIFATKVGPLGAVMQR